MSGKNNLLKSGKCPTSHPYRKTLLRRVAIIKNIKLDWICLI